jgi:hypothetical protein
MEFLLPRKVSMKYHFLVTVIIVTCSSLNSAELRKISSSDLSNSQLLAVSAFIRNEKTIDTLTNCLAEKELNGKYIIYVEHCNINTIDFEDLLEKYTEIKTMYFTHNKIGTIATHKNNKKYWTTLHFTKNTIIKYAPEEWNLATEAHEHEYEHVVEM